MLWQESPLSSTSRVARRRRELPYDLAIGLFCTLPQEKSLDETGGLSDICGDCAFVVLRG